MPTTRLSDSLRRRIAFSAMVGITLMEVMVSVAILGLTLRRPRGIHLVEPVRGNPA